jgi:hypothetical protein
MIFLGEESSLSSAYCCSPMFPAGWLRRCPERSCIRAIEADRPASESKQPNFLKEEETLPVELAVQEWLCFWSTFTAVLPSSMERADIAAPKPARKNTFLKNDFSG